jgi:hypothetical protein
MLVPDIFDTMLLLALPASGKSETRAYLTAKDPAEFHMGPTVQLDDYPYVHLQIVVDDVLAGLGHPQAFHHPQTASQRNGPFQDAREFSGLIHLINEDYAELRTGRPERPENPARRLLERFDAASEAVGARPKFRAMSADLRGQIERGIADEARTLFEEKAAACPASLAGMTIVIEFARGGPPGDSYPLPEGYGYRGALPHLSREILERAVVLYIWVTPEESRRKNRARARPGADGSILFHGTPEVVMVQEYSRCDMAWLVETAPVPGTVRVEAHGRTFDVPVERFDNRQDLTTFLREDPSLWQPADIARIHGALKGACDRLWATYSKRP